jgi:hypothetical protein
MVKLPADGRVAIGTVRIEQQPLIFAGSILLVVLLVLLIVGTETFRAAIRNPVDAIKHEKLHKCFAAYGIRSEGAVC